MELKTNGKSFVSDKERPEKWRKSCTVRALRLVVGDFEQAFCRSNHFCVMLAEVNFYYLANFYYAWEHAMTVMGREPPILLRQQVYNLVRLMHDGMEQYGEEDLERTCDSLDYLRYYNKFIEQVEDSTEFTLKFWTILLDERPSPRRLNELSRALFNSKYKIMNIIQKISRITSDHIDFLIRFGLFMKFVMHDQTSADQAFKRMIHLQETFSFSFARSHKFSIFSEDLPVMLIVASLTGSGAATICQINNEVERRLDYTREELVGCSVTNLMAPTVAHRHEKLVQSFFRTMESRNFGVSRLRFVKKADGTYVACDALNRLVPRLNEGIMIAAFFVPDPAISAYTTGKLDQTVKKVLDFSDK